MCEVCSATERGAELLHELQEACVRFDTLVQHNDRSAQIVRDADATMTRVLVEYWAYHRDTTMTIADRVKERLSGKRPTFHDPC